VPEEADFFASMPVNYGKPSPQKRAKNRVTLGGIEDEASFFCIVNVFSDDDITAACNGDSEK
jgi:hypothetical protein